VPAGDLLVQVLQKPRLSLPARVRAAVARELDEVDVVQDRDRPREVGEEDGRGLEGGDE